MAFEEPSHDVMQQARDEAEGRSQVQSWTYTVAAHNQYWTANGNGHQPSGRYFPGFEAGWAAACAELSGGNALPHDLDNWAKEHGEGEDWEWQHGFKVGAEKAREHGQKDEEQHEEQPQEEQQEE
jgi:hypothetical protein